MVRNLTVVMLLGLAAGVAQAGELTLGLSGDNTKITFIGTKPGMKHDGGFKTLKGSATWNGKDVTTLKMTVDIDLNSTWTDTDKVTTHLKSADFFDVKNHPKATFATTKIEKDGDGYTVKGKLTLNGKTKDVSFPAKIAAGGNSVDLSATFKINRHDWGVSYGKGMVSDDVSLTVSVAAKK